MVVVFPFLFVVVRVCENTMVLGCMVLKMSTIWRPLMRWDQSRNSLLWTLWWLWEPAVECVCVLWSLWRSRAWSGARLKSPSTSIRVLSFLSLSTRAIKVLAHLVYASSDCSVDAGEVGAYMLKMVRKRVFSLKSLFPPNL